MAEHMTVVVRHDARRDVASADLSPADNQWDVDFLPDQLIQSGLEATTLGGTWGVALNGA